MCIVFWGCLRNLSLSVNRIAAFCQVVAKHVLVQAPVAGKEADHDYGMVVGACDKERPMLNYNE